MRPLEDFLVQMLGLTEECTNESKNSAVEDEECEKCETSVVEAKRATEDSSSLLEDTECEKCETSVVEAKRATEDSSSLLEEAECAESIVAEEPLTHSGFCNGMVDLDQSLEILKQQEMPLAPSLDVSKEVMSMEIDEFNSRETVRKLVNVNDDERNRLVELAKKCTFSIKAYKSIDEMQSYCIENGIKADFTVNRKQFLRIRQKTKSNEVDFSQQLNGKKRKREYEVESILDYDKQSEKYLVKWVDWAHEFNTWEPEKHLDSCDELLNKFRSEMEIFERDNLVQEWLRKFDKLQSYITQITKKEYDDICVLQRLCKVMLKGSVQKETFNIKIAKKLIWDKTRILDEIENDFTFGPKRITNIVCEELKIFETFGSLEAFFDFIEQRKSTSEKLKVWESEINEIITLEGKSKKVYVENIVDVEGPPPDFTYITECKMNINEETNRRIQELNMNPVSWCSHKDCYEDKKNCCPKILDSKLVYTREGTVRNVDFPQIVECNSRCNCGDDCPNRVIQKGTQVELVIFRTKDRGWGVKAKERIFARRFVMEYIGEIITLEEADERGTRYDSEGRTYLFDLDFDVEAECAYSVDATKYGNVSHFVNHSCDPNMEVFVAWINHLDRQLPRLVFFSTRQIAKGEELTFDYKMTRPEIRRNEVPIECKCGSNACKKFLYI